MDDTQKMFQIIINGQSTFRQEVLSKFDKIDKRFDTLEKRLDGKIDGVEKRLTNRLDRIGKQLAYLEVISKPLPVIPAKAGIHIL